MPFSLLKFGLNKDYPFEQSPDLPQPSALKPTYDVVIIGGGGHGVATAYYLAKYHGITNVAVLEKAYLGGGNTARNTAVIRSNYLTPQGVHALRGQIVGADHCRIACRIATAQISFLEYRHIGDAMVLGKIIRRCNTVSAASDNDHIIGRF